MQKTDHEILADVCILGKALKYQESGWKDRSVCSLCEGQKENISRYNVGWYLLEFTFPETLHVIKMKPGET